MTCILFAIAKFLDHFFDIYHDLGITQLPLQYQ